MENGKNGFTPGDIEKMLGTNPNTLRKYAAALESAGHSFMRTTGGHRLFQEQDVTILRHFIALLAQPGMTVELGARVVVEKHNHAASDQPSKIVTVSEDSATLQRYDERYNELMTRLDRLPFIIERLEQVERERDEFKDMMLRQAEQMQRIETNMPTQLSVQEIAQEVHRLSRVETAAAKAAEAAAEKKSLGDRLLAAVGLQRKKKA